jgi:YD repeat-containing protein
MLLSATPMRRLLVWAPLMLVALCACDHDGPEARSPRVDRRLAVGECLAAIEVYPPGVALPQPYRVVAPLDAGFVGNWGWSSASRFKRMKKRACELGADAIIDAPDSVADNRVTTTYQYDEAGRPVAVVQEASREKHSTALAIQFLTPVVMTSQGVLAPPPMPAPVVVVPQATDAVVSVNPGAR